MNQNFTKEQADGLPAEMRALLTPNGEGFSFDFEPATDVTGLKSALRKERDTAAQAKRDLEAWRGVIGDRQPDEIQTLLQQAQQAEEDKLKLAGDWEKMKAQMLAEIEAKRIAPLTLERDRYRQAVDKYLVEAQLTTAISAAGAFPGAEKALLPTLRQYVKVIDENGEFAARAWNPTLDAPLVNEKGENLDFKTLIETKFKRDEIFGRLFQASGVGGSGAPAGGTTGASRNGKTRTRAEFDALSQVERMAHVRSGGVIIS